MLLDSYDNQPSVPELTASSDMTMAMVSKVLEMVSENKLTSVQGGELLSTLHANLTLTPGGKAHFVSMVNHSGEDLKRRVRITVFDSVSKQPQFELMYSLDEMLNYMDHFLQLVADNEFESLVFDGDSSPIMTELRIEKDEATS